MDDKIQTNMASMFKQHFKELTNHTTTYKNFASIGHVRISERKHNVHNKSAANNRNKANSNDQENINNLSTIRNKNGKKNTNSKGKNNKDTCSVLKTSIKGMQTKKSRRPSQDETFKVFHPKQAVWNGERTKLQSYIQQWHTQFKGLSDKKAIATLHKCLPPPQATKITHIKEIAGYRDKKKEI